MAGRLHEPPKPGQLLEARVLGDGVDEDEAVCPQSVAVLPLGGRLREGTVDLQKVNDEQDPMRHTKQKMNTQGKRRHKLNLLIQEIKYLEKIWGNGSEILPASLQ